MSASTTAINKIALLLSDEMESNEVMVSDRSLIVLPETVGLWRFKGNGIDESGNSNDFVTTDYNASDFVSGRAILNEPLSAISLNSAGIFPDLSNVLINAQSNDFNFDTGNFTIEMWLKLKSTLTASDQFSFRKKHTNGIQNFWNVTNNSGYKIGINLLGSISGSVFVNGITAVNDNAWHLHTIVVNRSDNTCKFYLDGIADGSHDISTIVGNIGTTGDLTDLRLNVNTISDGAVVDEICVSKKALILSEIVSRYNGIFNSHNKANLILPALSIEVETDVPLDKEKAIRDQELLDNRNMRLSIKIHTAYRLGPYQTTSTLNIADQVIRLLRENINLLDGFRIFDVIGSAYSVEHETSGTTGAELLVDIHKLEFYEQA